MAQAMSADCCHHDARGCSIIVCLRAQRQAQLAQVFLIRRCLSSHPTDLPRMFLLAATGQVTRPYPALTAVPLPPVYFGNSLLERLSASSLDRARASHLSSTTTDLSTLSLLPSAARDIRLLASPKVVSFSLLLGPSST